MVLPGSARREVPVPALARWLLGLGIAATLAANVVATTRRGSLMYSRNRFHAPWGAAFPAGNLASFHVITTGACWLTVDGADPVQLTPGRLIPLTVDGWLRTSDGQV